MKGKNVKVTVGVLVIVTAIAYLIFAGMGNATAAYSISLEDAQNGNKYYRIEGQLDVSKTTFSANKTPVELKFELYSANDPSKKITVIYYDVKPDNFAEATSAVVEGKFNSDGSFKADKLMLKCPSKYELSQEDSTWTKFRLSAWWAGNSGSLLLWLFLLSWYTVAVAFSKKTRNLTPYASSILLFNAAFFLFVLAFLENPFTHTQDWQPGMLIPDGSGMNPILQNPGMVFHPVTTYLGYVGFAVPFAYAMTALLIKNADDQWIKVTRRWTIIAWMFLSLGNLWGAQWAYGELGWGGYWAWDPVENASFILWLTGSAFLHSVMVQERKDMLKVWNVALIAITYVLTLFGTFLVRSGILTSVHAFRSGPIGHLFLAFTIFMLFGSLFLIVDRRKLLVQERNFESFLSKESSFLLNNLVLVGMAFAVF